MSTPLVIVGFIVATCAALAASYLLVSLLERLGDRWGMSEGILGIIAALAADSPEVTAAVTAVLAHQATTGFGVVIGSNVFNLAALLGVGALAAGRIDLHRRVVIFAGAVATGVAVLCLAATTRTLAPGAATAATGVLLGGYALALAVGPATLRRLGGRSRAMAWVAAAVEAEEIESAEYVTERPGASRDVIGALLALLAVIGASVAMERTAASLGNRWHLSEIVVGGLILAAVTSLPNAVAAVYLALRGRGAATLSTALNSNSLNVLAGFLIPATLYGLGPTGTGTTAVALWYLALTVLTLIGAYALRGITRLLGLSLIAGYVLFAIRIATG